MNLPWVEKHRPKTLEEISGQESVIKLLKETVKSKNVPHMLLYGPPGTGKCLGYNTPVLMSDNTTKMVQNIVKGDKLMGDDETYRNVLSVCKGKETMYEIKQSNGMNYIVNKSHILSLMNEKMEKIDISLTEYLNLTNDNRLKLKGYKKNGETSTITVNEMNEEYYHDEYAYYYGFTIDGNHRFLLEDTTVTHNTTSILALARELYGKEYNNRVLEMNASDERGIAVVREKIRNFASGSVTSGVPFKLIILDEADSMTKDAQSALRRIIETYTQVTRFCLICNYVSKIIEPLISRCAMFKFKPLSEEPLKLRLMNVCDLEQIKINDEALKEILRISKGDLRSSITLLQCASQYTQGKVTLESIVEISGTVPKDILEDIWNCLSKDFKKVQEQIIRIINEGYSAQMLISDIGRNILETNKFSDEKRMEMFIVLADAEKALVDGADEQLQLLKIMSRFFEIIKV